MKSTIGLCQSYLHTTVVKRYAILVHNTSGEEILKVNTVATSVLGFLHSQTFCDNPREYLYITNGIKKVRA